MKLSVDYDIISGCRKESGENPERARRREVQLKNFFYLTPQVRDTPLVSAEKAKKLRTESKYFLPKILFLRLREPTFGEIIFYRRKI